MDVGVALSVAVRDVVPVGVSVGTVVRVGVLLTLSVSVRCGAGRIRAISAEYFICFLGQVTVPPQGGGGL